jgi:hypothetical protein
VSLMGSRRRWLATIQMIFIDHQSLKKDKPAFKAGFYFDHADRSLSRLVFSKVGIWNFCLVLSFQKSEITCLVLSCLVFSKK